MSTPEERLQRSLSDFYVTLDALRVIGMSQVAETRQLKILVGQRPTLKSPGCGACYSVRLCREWAFLSDSAVTRDAGESLAVADGRVYIVSEVRRNDGSPNHESSGA
ncbi:hypothetical protein [Actinoallomurus sp. NPDC050550]|uniref:hypothetical protein n=1 Tax=Actinoallomurus sp. NPDC050550 TaxID=3154937 RepID=UPI00340C702F